VPPFVGRDRELRELENGLESAIAGRGGLLLISGDPGIGKTRLCEELVDRAAARGVQVAWARCWEAGSQPAFWFWEQLLGQLSDNPLPAPHPGGTAEDPDVARLRYFDDMVDRVRRVASAAPLVLVVDDLHWADVASIRMLAYLASQLRDIPALVLASTRDVDATPGSAAGDAIGLLARSAGHVRLSGLDAGEIHALIDSMAEDVDAGSLHHHTGGNPLFALELARHLDARGSKLRADEMPPVPATVRGVLTHRLNALTPDCRAALDVAAVVGDEFGVDVVEAVTGLDRHRLLELVDEAVRAHLVRDAGVAAYAFTHPLVRATLYDDLRIARRVRLHERVGVALEARRAQGANVDPAALAHHFLEAAPGGTAAKAAGYAIDAARRAMAHLAYESAVRLYEQALAVLELDPSAADRCEVLLGLGAAELAAGRQPAARAVHLEAAGLARTAGRADCLARAALGVGGGGGFEVGLGDREQIDLLEEARRGLGSEPSVLLAQVMARLSVALSLSGADDRRLGLSEDAVALARAVDDAGALAYALAAHCDAIAGPGSTERRLEEASEIVDLATVRGDHSTELLGRRLRLVALLELGRIAAADAEIEAYARLAHVLRQPLYGWYVPLWRAMRALMRADFDACARLVDKAAELGAQAHSDNATMLTESLRWYLMRDTGDTEGALAILDRFAPFTAVFGVQFRVATTLTLADAGRTEEARTRLDADVVAIRTVPVDSEWLSMLAQLAQVIARIGGHPLAEWAYGALLPHRDLFGVEGIGAAWWGSVERPLGLLAASLGRTQEAVEHFDAAVVANGATGCPLCVAATLRDAGLALGDQERLGAALTLFRELGVSRRVAELDGLIAPAQPANVFHREGDVWTLGYAGRVVLLKDVKGLRDLATLIAHPGREVAASDLASAPGAVPQAGLGDVVDRRARAAYKARLLELDGELEEADRAGDTERSARAHEERAAILGQLAGAYGLGGRPRRIGDDTERARQAVTWRIRDALARVEAVHPPLGQHLRRSVRTGTFCVYAPDEPVDWSL
jgi:tetratricopeptide (TPR) repeat protein